MKNSMQRETEEINGGWLTLVVKGIAWVAGIVLVTCAVAYGSGYIAGKRECEKICEKLFW